MMFKNKKFFIFSLILLVLAISGVSKGNQIEAQGTCIGNCQLCSNDPMECSYVRDPVKPNRNLVCNKYSLGQKCDQIPNVFQTISRDNFSDWRVNQGLLRTQTCALQYMDNSENDANNNTDEIIPNNTPNYSVIALGTFNESHTLTRSFRITRSQSSAILMKMGFFFNFNVDQQSESQTNTTQTNQTQNNSVSIGDVQINIPTTTTTQQITETEKNVTITKRSFLKMKVKQGDQPQKQYILEFPLQMIQNPTQLKSVIKSPRCGYHFNFVHTFTILNDTESLNITLEPIQGLSFNWSMTKFQVFSGCSGFSYQNNDGICSNCFSGFFQIRNYDQSLMECGLCDSQCRTCFESRCTSCDKDSTLNAITGKCQFISNYKELNFNKKAKGISIPVGNNRYITNLIQSEDYQVILNTTLQSGLSYSEHFLLIYPQRLLTDRENAFLFYKNGVISKSQNISFYDLPLQNGFYIQGITSKLYATRLSQLQVFPESNQKNVTFQVMLNKTQNVAESFFISNFMTTQHQCQSRCARCSSDPRLKQCLECGFFFQLQNFACKNCPNGFFLKRINRTSNTESQNGLTEIGDNQVNEICVKCHSSCLQCLDTEITDCRACFPYFQLQKYIFKTEPIRCIFDYIRNPNRDINSTCTQHLKQYSIDNIRIDPQCISCMNTSSFSQVTSGFNCEDCWTRYSLAHGRCIPTAESSFTYFGSDVSGGDTIDRDTWSGSHKLQTLTCSEQYEYLYGIKNLLPKKNEQGVQVDNLDTVTLTWTERKVPDHKGLAIIINIFKIDIVNNTNLTVGAYSGNQQIIAPKTVQLSQMRNLGNNTRQIQPVGSNICEGNRHEMIYTFTFDSQTHDQTDPLSIRISSPGGGIFVRQLEVYFGNCAQCSQNRLEYEIQYIPRYSYEAEKDTGLDVWLQFSRRILKFQNENDLKNAFTFKIDKIMNGQDLNITEFKNDMELNSRLQYFFKLKETFVNGSMTITKTTDSRIFASKRLLQRNLLNSQLTDLQTEGIIDRYSQATDDQKLTMEQLFEFYRFFQWFALITMIVTIMLGIGIVFQEFSILLQLLFIHVYISSALLPATFKAPLIGLERMENLNYFADKDIESIEDSWFGDRQHPSPYIFQQYNKDILFLRSFYPTIIINLIYLGWFILLLILRKVIKPFRESRSMIAQFFRNIPDRPINYFDQIWRYQFITTMWASFLQFQILQTDDGDDRLNVAICFIAFIISILWPIFIINYTYYITKYKYSTEFLYYYEDIYFKKMATNSQKDFKYYMYIAVRFGRYLIFALFIAVFTKHELIGAIILICVNILEIVYVGNLRIWPRSKIGPGLKILENILFIFVEIALLFVYGYSDSLNNNDFLNLGDALNVLYVIMVVIGLIRVAHHLIIKFKNYKAKNSYGLEAGEKKVYENTPLPQMDTNRQ